MKLTLHYPFDPVAKGRAKIVRVQNRSMAFTPKKTRQAETHFQGWLATVLPSCEWKMSSIAIALEIDFQIKRPKSVSYIARPFPIVKPDIDNYAKLIMDAGNGILWKDDSQVIQLYLRKYYDDVAGVNITVSEIGR